MTKKGLLNIKICGIKIDYILSALLLVVVVLFSVYTGKKKKAKFKDYHAFTVGKPIKKAYQGWFGRKVKYEFEVESLTYVGKSDYSYGEARDLSQNYVVVYCTIDPDISFMLLDYPISSELGTKLENGEYRFDINYPWWKF